MCIKNVAKVALEKRKIIPTAGTFSIGSQQQGQQKRLLRQIMERIVSETNRKVPAAYTS